MTADEAVTPSPTRTAWRLRRHASLRWRDWGGDSVVFERRSGQTYQFAPLAAAVLASLEESPQRQSTLVHLIAGDLGCPVDEDLLQAVVTSLHRLQAIGWIEPASPPLPGTFDDEPPTP